MRALALGIAMMLVWSCGGPSGTTPAPDGATEVAGGADTSVPTDTPEPGDSSVESDAVTADLQPGSDTTVLSCPGGSGCSCKDNGNCDGGLCLDTPDGRICAVPCSGNCAAGFVCAQVEQGKDAISVCVPQFGWRCDPCTASAQCAGPGHADARCVRYGGAGSFCGSACDVDADCGPGFVCKVSQTTEGTTAQQCVLADAAGQCPCSLRASEKKLATTCTKAYPNDAQCGGQRQCASTGPQGLTACDAPAPTTETCDGKDQDCDGQTDEATCNDSNPCTEDACVGKGGGADGCSHMPKDGFVCDDGDPCTVGDSCQGGTCKVGVSVCQCKQDSDCDSAEDGNLCNGTLVCDLTVHKCKVDPKTVVTCPVDANTACSQNTCEATTGKCSMKSLSTGTLCDDGNPCTVADSCAAGVCKPGTNTCECQQNSDCAALEDGDKCNGTLVCDLGSHKCKVDTSTLVTCDATGDTACMKTTCVPATGACVPKPVTDGTACSDSNPCTVGDGCASGTCKPGSNTCQCQKDADCLPMEDADKCNGTLICDLAANKCKVDPKTVVTCDSSADTKCTKSACDPKVGTCAPKPVPDATPCSDGNVCTSADACKTGQCQGSVVNCADANPCTDDACDSGKGCVHTPNTAACDDGNACTVGDVCAASQCKAGPPPGCTDGKQNGAETDVDCGGSGACSLAACKACAVGKKCALPSDCTSLVCTSGVCKAATCSDKVQNGDEDGVDCGGACPLCATTFVLAGGPSVQAATQVLGGAWQVSSLGKPTVDGVTLVPLTGPSGVTGVVGLVRHTKLLDLEDNGLMFTVHTNQAWSPLMALGPGVTTRGWPAATEVAGGVQVVFQGMDYKHYFSAFSGSWSNVAPVGAPQSYGPAPGALAFSVGKTTFAYSDGAAGNHLTTRDYSATTWGALQDLAPAGEFSVPPTLVAPKAGPELMVVHVQGGSGQVRFQTRQGATWTSPADVPSTWTKDRPALAALPNGTVLLAFRGTDGKVYVTAWVGGTWGSPVPVGNGTTVASPAVAKGSKGAEAELMWVAADGSVQHSRLVDGGWSAPVAVLQGATSVAVVVAP